LPVEDELVSVEIRVGVEPDSDDEELAELTARLRRLLLELDVAGVDRPSSDEAPAGAKGVEAMALGTLAVTLARRAGALRAITAGVQSWLTAQRNRTVKIELDGDTLELTGVSSREQERLVDLWIDRHASRA